MVSIKVVEFDFANQLGVRVRVGAWERWWRIRSPRQARAWLHLPEVIKRPFNLEPSVAGAETTPKPH